MSLGGQGHAASTAPNTTQNSFRYGPKNFRAIPYNSHLTLLRLLAAIALAFIFGKLISKLKLPSILGWLITGMVFGPHALSLINNELLAAPWYTGAVHVLECAVGLMIGTELVWNKIKKSGRSIVITTLTQSLGTFLLVLLVFDILFWVSDIPLYLAFLFGAIALAPLPPLLSQ